MEFIAGRFSEMLIIFVFVLSKIPEEEYQLSRTRGRVL